MDLITGIAIVFATFGVAFISFIGLSIGMAYALDWWMNRGVK